MYINLLRVKLFGKDKAIKYVLQHNFYDYSGFVCIIITGFPSNYTPLIRLNSKKEISTAIRPTLAKIDND